MREEEEEEGGGKRGEKRRGETKGEEGNESERERRDKGRW